jgi:ATP-dependent DNA helicase RecQ
VASDRWGEGTVQRYDGDQLTVLFDDHGYRDLLVPLVLERGLLCLASSESSRPAGSQR